MTPRRPRLSTSRRLHLFERHKGLCHICGQPIDGGRQDWEIEHVVPQGPTGQAADPDETMQPVHACCSAATTPKAIQEMAKARRRWARRIGAWRASPSPPGSPRSPTAIETINDRSVIPKGG